ncbi:MAG: hypothetical protein ACK4ZJ_16940, partial [Allorhizobium sp.]
MMSALLQREEARVELHSGGAHPAATQLPQFEPTLFPPAAPAALAATQPLPLAAPAAPPAAARAPLAAFALDPFAVSRDAASTLRWRERLAEQGVLTPKGDAGAEAEE